MNRAMVLLTWGHTNPRLAKTASGLLRFCDDECLAVFDPDHVGKFAGELLGVGNKVPIIDSLDQVPDAKTLVIGIAPPGGKIPEHWRPLIFEALRRGMNVLSGLHEFMSEDPEFAKAAQDFGVSLTDVRKCDFQEVATFPELNPDCFRMHTVGHDSSIGKMLAAMSLTRGLQSRGHDAAMIATGQTGIMVTGDGLPLDAVVSDFVSGAAESLITKYQNREMLVVEGQGSLVHPSYSAVTLGLLHGSRPHALIMVFQADRTSVASLEHIPLPSVAKQMELFESMASIYQPCPVVALAMNGSQLESAEARAIAQEMEQQLQLPVVDVIRDGPDRILDAVEEYPRFGSMAPASTSIRISSRY